MVLAAAVPSATVPVTINPAATTGAPAVTRAAVAAVPTTTPTPVPTASITLKLKLSYFSLLCDLKLSLKACHLPKRSALEASFKAFPISFQLSAVFITTFATLITTLAFSSLLALRHAFFRLNEVSLSIISPIVLTLSPKFLTLSTKLLLEFLISLTISILL